MTKSGKRKQAEKKTEKVNLGINKKVAFIIGAVFITFFSLSLVSYFGGFDNIHHTKIDFEKNYFVYYRDIMPPKVLLPGETAVLAKEGFGDVALVGYVDFQSSSFSAQNPIHAEIEMYHTQYGKELDVDFWNSLPNNFFAYFPKAKYIINTNNPFETEKSVIIQLEKFDNPPRIKGNGDFVYPREGNFDFYIFDPNNIPNFDELRTTLQISYHLSNGHLNETSSKYDAPLLITSADSFNSVISFRNTITFGLMGIALGVPSFIFAIRNYLFKTNPNSL